MATALPGLEDIAGDEIATKFGATATARELTRGKVLFASDLPAARLLELRSVDNLNRHIARFTVGPHREHLKALTLTASELDLSRIVAQSAGGGGAASGQSGRSLTVFVNASRVGKQTYSRFELAAAATDGILTRNRHWQAGTPTAHDLEFRLDLIGEEAMLSLRLSDQAFRFRGEARRFSEAALRPTVAHALVWLAGPRADERFLDPFCGSGTIVAERAAYPALSIVGSDIADAAVAAARQNVPPTVAVNQWDARQLPLQAGTVDTVVSNLPFGRQILTSVEIAPLYQDFCRELHRVLVADGQALLLTDQIEQLTQAAAEAGLACEQLRLLSLKGLHPWLFRVGH
jgi:23S rRNA G2445 N2-methylase RlmL